MRILHIIERDRKHARCDLEYLKRVIERGLTHSRSSHPRSLEVAITFQPGPIQGKTRISIFYPQNRCVLRDSQKYLILAQGIRTVPGSHN